MEIAVKNNIGVKMEKGNKSKDDIQNKTQTEIKN